MQVKRCVIPCKFTYYSLYCSISRLDFGEMPCFTCENSSFRRFRLYRSPSLLSSGKPFLLRSSRSFDGNADFPDGTFGFGVAIFGGNMIIFRGRNGHFRGAKRSLRMGNVREGRAGPQTARFGSQTACFGSQFACFRSQFACFGSQSLTERTGTAG